MSSVEECFRVVPDKYRKTGGELGISGDDSKEKFISLDWFKISVK